MNQGFFDRHELRELSQEPKKPDCARCKLHLNCYSPKMEAHGQGKKGILLVGEAPGTHEDRANEQFVGDSGIKINNMLRKLGIDMNRDCWKTNSVNCAPGRDNKNGEFIKPTGLQIQCCRPMVMNIIREKKPKVIIPLGKYAILSVIGNRFKKDIGGPTKWRGYVIPDQDLEAFICPTYHPSFVSREEEQNESIAQIWREDLEQAISYVDKPFPKSNLKEAELCCFPLRKENDIVRLLSAIKKVASSSRKPYSCAVDYETTGLKPHREGHSIYSCAIAISTTQSYAFPVISPKVISALRDFWEDENISKVAANMKYEDVWTRQILGITPKHWGWDTMIAAHVLDNRVGVTSLKFQTYIQFGIPDYDSHISHYLESAEGSNGKNRIHLIPLKDVFLYNALDSLFELRLAKLQMTMMDRYDGSVHDYIQFRFEEN